MQTSVEFNVLSQQIYKQAGYTLDKAIADMNWTAAKEQTGDFQKLPPAVILDLDETVLDNTPFEAMLVKKRLAFSENLWIEWINKAVAKAVPGAKEFLTLCNRKSVRIFYVTNRKANQEEYTIKNMVALGLPVDLDGSNLLLRNEKPNWNSDKTSRRAEVASKYRIILLVGDDLGDFLTSATDTLEKRMELVKGYEENWGSKWFLLPNPIYGSWESSLYGFQYNLTDEEILKQKYEHLQAY
jgi:acid phosphatase